MPDASQKKGRRPRRSRAEWAQIIERFDAGTDSVSAFCRSEGIGVGSFYQWRNTLQTSQAPAPRFIELEAPFASPPVQWQVELDLGDGVVLRLRRG